MTRRTTMMTTNPTNSAISMGRAQADWAEWAIDPMADYWTTEQEAHARDGKPIPESYLPRVIRPRGLSGQRYLEWDHCPIDVLEDLIYRLGEQAPDMEEVHHASSAAAIRLADKIRSAIEQREESRR